MKPALLAEPRCSSSTASASLQWAGRANSWLELIGGDRVQQSLVPVL